MKMKCYFSKDGTLLNIGEWDRQVRPAYQEEDVIDPAVDIPEVVKDGKVVQAAFVRPAKLISKGRLIPERVDNEIPDGVVIEEREVVQTEHGRFLADDHARLRKSEYPPIGDQLDAIWKIIGGGESPIPDEAADVLAKINAVKEKYPK